MPADQALGMVSFGLMQRLAQDGQVELPWLETPRNEDQERSRQLRQRLELTARPGHERVERGGLVARRISRNVWRLSRLDQEDRQSGYRTDGFRRRL